MIQRYKKWRDWKKYNNNNTWFYQILVLFGLIKSPTFETWYF